MFESVDNALKASEAQDKDVLDDLDQLNINKSSIST